MVFGRGKNDGAAFFLHKGFTSVPDSYTNPGRLGDALTVSRLPLQCGKCSTEYWDTALLQCPSIASGPEMKLRNRNASKKEGVIIGCEVFKPIQVRGGLCCLCRHSLKRDGGKDLEKARGYNWKKKSRMKGLNFKNSVRKEILVPLSQLASKF